MDKQIQEKFNDKILKEAMLRFGITEGNIKIINNGFMNIVYEFCKDNKNYILRIGHSSRRSEPLIQAEVDWIYYLAENGAAVHQVIFSEDNNLVEHVPDSYGGYFLVTAFVKANGSFYKNKLYTYSDENVYQILGQTIGKFHSLTKNYNPTHMNCIRSQWNGPIMLNEVENNLPKTDYVIQKLFFELKHYIINLSKNIDSFGLVHSDPHFGNFFIDSNNTITWFDFDECEYNWFINDIAISFFYEFYKYTRNDIKSTTKYLQSYLTNFLIGYSKENKLEPKWLKEIPYFLKFREFVMYALINAANDSDKPDNFMLKRKEFLENNIPYVDFDFESMTKYL